jgi:kynureninase
MNTLQYAQELDEQDSLKKYKDAFIIPQHNGKFVHYFCGNSLGLQPKTVERFLKTELESWAKYGVEGHFMGKNPWMPYHHLFKEILSEIVGAKPHEVSVMNTLTTNLHLLMVSFYRPTAQRYKIVMEAGAFPSDQYAMESQVKYHGYNPDEAIIELKPRLGEYVLRTADILNVIEENKMSIATLMIGGVNYYTGQLYDIQAITNYAKKYNITVGWDLAHAAGNVLLQLHNWEVDFAVWCSYKYLNSGPGGPSGFFVHEKHAQNPNLPRFAGWWGHDEKERFKMQKGYKPMYGADAWQLSNAQIFAMAPHLASIQIFHEAKLENLRAKSLKLTSYLYNLLIIFENKFDIITPNNPDERGCQISILASNNGKKLFDYLQEKGIVTDWREPNVIRVAPVPLYNTFEDCWHLYKSIETFYESE